MFAMFYVRGVASNYIYVCGSGVCKIFYTHLHRNKMVEQSNDIVV